jgi:Iap family predicted aminopeptidase
VAARLAEAGWLVRRHAVRVRYFEVRSAVLGLAGRRLRRPRHFQVASYSGSGRARGRLVRVSDGCAQSGFAGVGPGEIPVAEVGGCLFRTMARNAQRQGARALLVLAPVSSSRGVGAGTLASPGIRIPVVFVSPRVIAATGEGAAVRVRVDARSGVRRNDNVVAETPAGSGERVVMAGGHLDSVEAGPGINDNGSGVATLIELAEAIGPEPPGARVRVGFWAAEELGLVGSSEYVASLSRAERRRIAAYVNFDMVGSPNAVPELYAGADRGIARLLRRVWDGRLGAADIAGASDHAPFERAGIPVNGLYTGSSERGRGGRPRDPCYHLPCDRLGNVSPRVLLKVAGAAAEAMAELSRRSSP